MREGVLFSDGGSRGNPGHAGIGFDLLDCEGVPLAQGGAYIGETTNNVAEYSALIWGLQNALDAQIQNLKIRVDSELVAKQLNGIYKVKSDDLKPLHLRARSLMSEFERVEIEHVYRENNKVADEMANEAMDSKSSVGTYRVPWVVEAKNLFDEPSLIEDSLVTTATPSNASMGSGEELDLSATTKNLSTDSSYQNEGVYEMTIKDHFDAAHRLIDYDGPCRHLHGHTWDIEATVSGRTLDKIGIVYDFKALKQDLHSLLDAFDHKYLNDVPPFDTLNPTAENLAKHIFHELELRLPIGITLKEIVVWESPKAKITYHR